MAPVYVRISGGFVNPPFCMLLYLSYVFMGYKKNGSVLKVRMEYLKDLESRAMRTNNDKCNSIKINVPTAQVQM